MTRLFPTDWLFGPKMAEEDSEEGRDGAEEEWIHLTERDELKTEAEKDGVLPGSLRPSVHPPSPALLKSALVSSHPGEKRFSAHSVTFTCPQSPQVTSP